MVRIVLGSGNSRQSVVMENRGRVHHEQRRFLKRRLGLLR